MLLLLLLHYYFIYSSARLVLCQLQQQFVHEQIVRVYYMALIKTSLNVSQAFIKLPLSVHTYIQSSIVYEYGGDDDDDV